MSCLQYFSFLAAKFEEPDDHLPTIEALQRAAQFGLPDYYTREEFQAMEIYLLRVFKWTVSHPTAAHFTDYYLYHSLNEEPYSTSNGWDSQVLNLQMKQYCGFFLENTLRGMLYNLLHSNVHKRTRLKRINRIHVMQFDF